MHSPSRPTASAHSGTSSNSHYANDLRMRKQDGMEKEPLPNGIPPTLEGKSQKTKESQIVPSSSRKYFTALIFTLISFASRFVYLNHPDQVVFDEVHFGKFASYYLRGTYYFDVHPPLGKLMLAATGWLAGYDGSYLFDKIGDGYLENHVPYIIFRAVPAAFGALIVPLVFLILTETRHSFASASVGAAMALLDTALITQTRLILLDSFLLFFDIFAVYSWVKFYSYRNRPYQARWWIWLTLTGIGISCATSVKLVGLFIVALVGCGTIYDLWNIIDYRRGLSTYQIVTHFLSRVFALIALPLAVYLGFFSLHFSILYKSGPGDNFMSPKFQAGLEGNRLNQPSFLVFYGSNITLYHYNTGAFLHSHSHNYPLRYEDDRVSSAGQQVTGYPHSDDNNLWSIFPADGEYEEITKEGQKIPRSLRGVDIVRLQHVKTGNYMLTHDVASPLMPTHQEITCVGEEKKDRYNETLFKIVLESAKNENERVSTIDAKLRICHVVTKVCLHSYKSKLGEWAFGQQEVNGNKNSKDKNNVWIIDSATSKHPPKSVRKAISGKQMSFLERFWELQNVMLKQNAALTSSHPFQSTPWTWPILTRGISFWVDNKDSQIYLIGNPLTWYIGFFAISLHLSILLIDALARRRGLILLDYRLSRKLYVTGGFFVAGWALHYLPFFIMGRALFLHHYLPAVVYTYLVTANVFEFALHAEKTVIRTVFAAAFITMFAVGFWVFMPFSYGLPLTTADVDARKFFETWDFSFATKV